MDFFRKTIKTIELHKLRAKLQEFLVCITYNVNASIASEKRAVNFKAFNPLTLHQE